MSWPWSDLGLEDGADLAAIKHAYAEQLKTTHPEDDPEGFQRLHGAYQAACRLARRAAKDGAPPPPVPPGDMPHREGEADSGSSDPYGDGWDYDRLFREGEAGRSQIPPDPASGECGRTPPPFVPPLSPQPNSGERARHSVVILIASFLGVCGLLFVFSVIPLLFSHLSPSRTAAPIHTTAQTAAPTPTPRPTPVPNKVLRGYLEEDLGIKLSPIVAAHEGGVYSFQLEGNPELRFQARLTGERDTGAGSPGYETDYADALLYHTLEKVRDTWELKLFFDAEQTVTAGMGPGDTQFPSIYHLVIPTTGAEEVLSDLGGALSGLSEQYSETLYPQAILVVGRGGLALESCNFSRGEAFDLERARSIYETDFAGTFALYVLEESGAAEEDVGPDCVISALGPVKVKGEVYYRFDVTEHPDSSTVKAQYFVLADGSEIKCVPVPWPEKLSPQPGGGVPQAFSYYLTSDLLELPGRLTVDVDRYFDWSKL